MLVMAQVMHVQWDIIEWFELNLIFLQNTSKELHEFIQVKITKMKGSNKLIARTSISISDGKGEWREHFFDFFTGFGRSYTSM